jgi:hypothetical protein
MIYPLIGYLLHCTILMAYFGLSKEILLQSSISSLGRFPWPQAQRSGQRTSCKGKS